MQLNCFKSGIALTHPLLLTGQPGPISAHAGAAASFSRAILDKYISPEAYGLPPASFIHPAFNEQEQEEKALALSVKILLTLNHFQNISLSSAYEKRYYHLLYRQCVQILSGLGNQLRVSGMSGQTRNLQEVSGTDGQIRNLHEVSESDGRTRNLQGMPGTDNRKTAANLENQKELAQPDNRQYNRTAIKRELEKYLQEIRKEAEGRETSDNRGLSGKQRVYFTEMFGKTTETSAQNRNRSAETVETSVLTHGSLAETIETSVLTHGSLAETIEKSAEVNKMSMEESEGAAEERRREREQRLGQILTGMESRVKKQKAAPNFRRNKTIAPSSFLSWKSQQAKQFFWRVQRAPEMERRLILAASNTKTIVGLMNELRMVGQHQWAGYAAALSERVKTTIEDTVFLLSVSGKRGYSGMENPANSPKPEGHTDVKSAADIPESGAEKIAGDIHHKITADIREKVIPDTYGKIKAGTTAAAEEFKAAEETWFVHFRDWLLNDYQEAETQEELLAQKEELVLRMHEEWTGIERFFRKILENDENEERKKQEEYRQSRNILTGSKILSSFGLSALDETFLLQNGDDFAKYILPELDLIKTAFTEHIRQMEAGEWKEKISLLQSVLKMEASVLSPESVQKFFFSGSVDEKSAAVAGNEENVAGSMGEKSAAVAGNKKTFFGNFVQEKLVRLCQQLQENAENEKEKMQSLKAEEIREWYQTAMEAVSYLGETEWSDLKEELTLSLNNTSLPVPAFQWFLTKKTDVKEEKQNFIVALSQQMTKEVEFVRQITESRTEIIRWMTENRSAIFRQMSESQTVTIHRVEENPTEPIHRITENLTEVTGRIEEEQTKKSQAGEIYQRAVDKTGNMDPIKEGAEFVPQAAEGKTEDIRPMAEETKLSFIYLQQHQLEDDKKTEGEETKRRKTGSLEAINSAAGSQKITNQGTDELLGGNQKTDLLQNLTADSAQRTETETEILQGGMQEIYDLQEENHVLNILQEFYAISDQDAAGETDVFQDESEKSLVHLYQWLKEKSQEDYKNQTEEVKYQKEDFLTLLEREVRNNRQILAEMKNSQKAENMPELTESGKKQKRDEINQPSNQLSLELMHKFETWERIRKLFDRSKIISGYIYPEISAPAFSQVSQNIQAPRVSQVLQNVQASQNLQASRDAQNVQVPRDTQNVQNTRGNQNVLNIRDTQVFPSLKSSHALLPEAFVYFVRQMHAGEWKEWKQKVQKVLEKREPLVQTIRNIFSLTEPDRWYQNVMEAVSYLDKEEWKVLKQELSISSDLKNLFAPLSFPFSEEESLLQTVPLSLQAAPLLLRHSEKKADMGEEKRRLIHVLARQMTEEKEVIERLQQHDVQYFRTFGEHRNISKGLNISERLYGIRENVLEMVRTYEEQTKEEHRIFFSPDGSRQGMEGFPSIRWLKRENSYDIPVTGINMQEAALAVIEEIRENRIRTGSRAEREEKNFSHPKTAQEGSAFPYLSAAMVVAEPANGHKTRQEELFRQKPPAEMTADIVRQVREETDIQFKTRENRNGESKQENIREEMEKALKKLEQQQIDLEEKVSGSQEKVSKAVLKKLQSQLRIDRMRHGM